MTEELRNFKAECREHDGHVELVLEGELDLATVPRVRHELKGSPVPDLVDLTGVTFIDSVGAGFFMRLKKKHTTLRFACSPEVSRVLELFALDDQFTPIL